MAENTLYFGYNLKTLRDIIRDETVDRLSFDMYVVRGKCEVYHPATQVGPEYLTPCGRVVPETLMFDEVQDNLPATHLIPKRPPGRRLCSRCKFVSHARARQEARKTIDSTP